MLPDFRLQRFLFGVVDNLGANLAADGLRAALQDAHDGYYILATGASDLFGPLVRVHVPCFAADESFIRFNLPGELVAGLQSQREADSMIHEPRRFLGDSDGSMNFATADTVLGVHNLPHGH